MRTTTDSQANMYISCADLSRWFSRRAAHYPVSDRYIRLVHDSREKTGRDEREHMVSWFAANATTGSGAYSRKAGNEDARRCYNRLQNAASLLWIAEAAGVDQPTVEEAYTAAVAASDRRKACGAIRRVIPWAAIYERLPKKLKVIPR